MTKEVILPEFSLVNQQVYWVTYKTTVTQDSCITPNPTAAGVKTASLEFPAQPAGSSSLKSLSRQLQAAFVTSGRALANPTLSEFLLPIEFLWFPEPRKPLPSGQEEMFHSRRVGQTHHNQLSSLRWYGQLYWFCSVCGRQACGSGYSRQPCTLSSEEQNAVAREFSFSILDAGPFEYFT